MNEGSRGNEIEKKKVILHAGFLYISNIGSHSPGVFGGHVSRSPITISEKALPPNKIAVYVFSF